MLSVQVERDPKTGATVVRSVAPVSSPSGAPAATTIFDDGRRSIHAVGGAGDQPSSEELGQILSAIDGVGMKVLLDQATPTQAQEEAARAEPPVKTGCAPGEIRGGEQKVGNGNTMVVQDMDGKEVSITDRNMEDGPVTLLFLGYDDGASNQEDDQGGCGGMLTAERVIITEDGEVIAPEETQEEDPPSSTPQPDSELNPDRPKPPSAEHRVAPKRNKCQCCSVM